MGRQLIALRDIVPNKDEGTHYLFDATTANAYVTALVANYLQFRIDLDNYVINKNIAKVKKSASLSSQSMYKITYLIDYEINKYFRAYHVNKCYEQSGYVIFELEQDLWANGFYGGGTLNHLHVSRCNHLIDLTKDPTYDEIKETQGITQFERYFRLTPLTYDDVVVVISLEFNVYASLFGNDVVTKTALVAVKLKTLYDALHAIKPAFDNVDIVDKAVDMVGGIYEVFQTGLQSLAARVLKAWIVPSVHVDLSTQGFNVTSKSLYTEGSQVQFAVNFVNPDHKTKTINLRYDLTTPTDWETFYWPNAHVEVGVPYRGLAIPREVGIILVYYHFVYTNMDLKVYVQYGQKQEDITDGFEVEITTNNATATSSMHMARALSQVSKGIIQLAKGAAIGGAGGAVASGAIYGVGMLSNIKNKETISAVGSGDGGFTYRKNSPTEVHNPFAMTYTYSAINEKEHAYFNGANFDDYIHLEDVLATEIGEPFDAVDERDGYYIAIDRMTITGMQGENADFVRQEFNRGIWLYRV